MLHSAQMRRSLLTVLLAAALVLPAAAQNGGGYDFFRTDPKGTKVTFTGAFALPRGFFGEGYGGYKGTVYFKGVPLETFKDHKTGRADTVMQRKSSPPKATKYPSESKTEIELAALSLWSTKPIRVSDGKKTELWDVKVGLSSRHPSTGTMILTQRTAKGGVARSEFTVYPVFTFIRQGDKTEKTLDVGTSNLAADNAKQLTLKASNIPWTNTGKAGALTDGIQVGTARVGIRHSGLNESHFVIAIPPLELPRE
jgi:hypothetical protein